MPCSFSTFPAKFLADWNWSFLICNMILRSMEVVVFYCTLSFQRSCSSKFLESFQYSRYCAVGSSQSCDMFYLALLGPQLNYVVLQLSACLPLPSFNKRRKFNFVYFSYFQIICNVKVHETLKKLWKVLFNYYFAIILGSYYLQTVLKQLCNN